MVIFPDDKHFKIISLKRKVTANTFGHVRSAVNIMAGAYVSECITLQNFLSFV